MRILKNKVIAFKEANKLTSDQHQFVDKLAQSNIPISYWLLPMSRFQGSEQVRETINTYLGDLRKNYLEGKGFVLAGPYGIGKTYGMCSLLKSAIRVGFDCYYTSLPDLSIYGMSKLYRDEYMACCLKADLLAFDELDSRHIPTSDEGKAYFGAIVEKILRERIQNQLPTFFSTNNDSAETVFIGQQFRAISSLLSQSSTTVACIGKDFRKAGKEK